MVLNIKKNNFVTFVRSLIQHLFPWTQKQIRNDKQNSFLIANEFDHYQTIYVAYSGGLDSHCLLHMLSQQEVLKSKIKAIHVNHGIYANSTDWQQHCQKICKELQIPCEIISLSINKNPGESLEEIARNARYAGLAKFINKNDVLLTAQHQDDQAETVLLQLIRGAGIKGLAAMAKEKDFAKGKLMRPLLDKARADLLEYAQQWQLDWIEDDSNQDQSFSRNYLRKSIIPLLKQRWPSINKNLSRSSQHCAQADQLLQEFAALDYKICVEKSCLLIEKLSQLSIERQRNLLRYWLRKNNCTIPSTICIERIINEVIKAKIDAAPLVAWPGGEVRRFQGALYALSKPPQHNENNCYQWSWQKSLSLQFQSGQLIAKKIKGKGFDPDKLPNILTVKYRQGGEKIKLVGSKKTHTLKKLLQESKIPPWQRNTIPLIFHENILISVVNFYENSDYLTDGQKTGIIFHYDSGDTKEI